MIYLYVFVIFLIISGRSHPVRVGAQAEVSKTKAGVSSQGARPKQRTATAELKKIQKDSRRGSREVGSVSSSSSSVVEEAQEATSAFAVQSLNHNHARLPRRVRSHAGTADTKEMTHIEIPMEDLSISTKARSGSLDNASKMLRLPAFRLEKHRSQSHSPRRHKSDSSVVAARSESRKHAASAPPPHSTRTRQTSLMNSRPHSKSSPAAVDHKRDESSSDESPDVNRSRNQSNLSPKSLRPAPAPSMSLIPHQQMSEFLPAGTINSPKLVPPAEPKIIPAAKVSQCKASAGDYVNAENRGKDGNFVEQKGKDMDKDSKDAESIDSDVSSGMSQTTQDSNSDSGVHSDQASQSSKATAKQQLAELAQEVQEHYSYSEDNKEEMSG